MTWQIFRGFTSNSVNRLNASRDHARAAAARAASAIDRVGPELTHETMLAFASAAGEPADF